MLEEEAIRRSQSGDREAFRYLVEHYQNVLYGTAYLMIGDRAIAEDQVQEAFLSAWKGIGGFKNGHPVKPWLVKILVNKVMSHRRSSSKSKLHLRQMTSDIAEDAAYRVEKQDQLERALKELSYEHRQVILLRYYAGLTLAEISAALNSPEGTIKSQLFRATERLRCGLNGKLNGGKNNDGQ